MSKSWIIAAALLLAGCGSGDPQGARLRVVVAGDDGLARRLAAEATAATLVGRDGNGQIIAGLATSWRFVDDGKSLILRLKPAHWDDGKPLTSKDVVASFDRAEDDPALTAAGLSDKAAALAPIARVVELRLTAASPQLLGWLAEPGLAIERPGHRTLAGYSRHNTKQGIELKRLSDTPSPATIGITSTEPEAAVALFGRGGADVVIGAGLAGLAAARSAARPEALRIDPLWGVYGYLANGLHGPLADSGVRRALAMAIDRPALTAGYGIGAMVPVAGLLPPSLAGNSGANADSGAGDTVAGAGAAGIAAGDAGKNPGAPRAIPGWTALSAEARLAEARRLLTAAGWTPAHPLRLVLLLPPGREHRSIAESVAAGWAPLGVLLSVTQVEADVRDRLVARGAFDLAVSEASIAVPDPLALLTRFRCGTGPWCNRPADAALAAAARAGPAERAAQVARAEALLADGPPLIGLFAPVRWALVGRNVAGWVPNAGASHPLTRLSVGAAPR